MTEKKRRGIDPTATKNNILKHAKALFVERGFSGTSMRDIANAAGMGQSMISHHFGSKEELWVKIKNEYFDNYVSQINECNLKACSPHRYRDELRNFIDKRINYFKKEPGIVRMMTWQSLENLQNVAVASPDVYKLVNDLVSDLEKAQEDGEIRDDIEAVYIMTFIFIVTKAWFQNNIMWALTEKHKDRDISPDQELDGYIDAIKKILDGGLFV